MSPAPRRRTRLHISWKGIVPALSFLAVVIGTLLGMGWLGVTLIMLLLPVHFIVLPKVAERVAPGLERRMVSSIAARNPRKADGIWRRALLVRLYAPRSYKLGKEAMVAAALGRLDRAESLYVTAIAEGDPQQRPMYMANLAGIKSRQGKEQEAEGLRREAVRLQPGLARMMEGVRLSPRDTPAQPLPVPGPADGAPPQDTADPAIREEEKPEPDREESRRLLRSGRRRR